jgi:hypothetical protein
MNQPEVAGCTTKEEELRRLEAEPPAKQEEEMKNSLDEVERQNEVRQKGLRIGDCVAVIGLGMNLVCDGLVHSFGGDGM